MGQPDVDGALVGGASLDADSFALSASAVPDRLSFPLVALVILDGWGFAPPGPGERRRARRDAGLRRPLGRATRTRRSRRSGEAVGLPDGPDGQLRGRPPDDRLGSDPRPGPERVNDAVERRHALRERGARGRLRAGAGARRERAPARASSPTAASTRTSTTCARCSSSRSGRGWTSAPGPRLHRRPRRLAARGGRRISPSFRPSGIATVVGPLLRDGPRQALGADEIALRRRSSTARASTPPTRSPPSQESYDAGVTDEFVEPIVLDGRPRLDREGRARSSSTSGPTARASCRSKLLERGVDLTTMTRYARTSRLPGRLRRAEHVAETMAEVLAEHGLRQLHVAETEKYAHVTYFFNGGREEELPGETRILVPSPRDVAELRQEAGDVGARGRRRASARRSASGSTRFASSTSPTPTWSATRARSRPSIKAVETVDSCLGEVVAAVAARRAASASSPPTTATPSRCWRTTASALTPRTRRTRSRCR